jgi:hypothetical protein
MFQFIKNLFKDKEKKVVNEHTLKECIEINNNKVEMLRTLLEDKKKHIARLALDKLNKDNSFLWAKGIETNSHGLRQITFSTILKENDWKYRFRIQFFGIGLALYNVEILITYRDRSYINACPGLSIFLDEKLKEEFYQIFKRTYRSQLSLTECENLKKNIKAINLIIDEHGRS